MNDREIRAARYWRRNRLIVSFFLLVWVGVTFGIAFYARELSSLDFMGWPFAYWVGAQGALIVYLFITVLFAFLMNRLDTAYQDTVLPQSEMENEP
ncbi:MAG: DUF4212 domain-containing protein [Burkholderiaceae bacterium]